ncbi:hypothetical protein ABZ078_43915, partial [Streptomyces sp. NPDC006385]
PANHILGLRLNVWTSLLLFTAAVAFLWLRRPGGRFSHGTAAAETADSATAAPPGPAEETPAAADASKTVTAPARRDRATRLLKETTDAARRRQ